MSINIISCQRNANKFSINCLESVRLQTQKVEKHIFIDDLSSDDTQRIVDEYLKTFGNENVFFEKNTKRKYRLQNIIDAMKHFKDDDIVCLLDGDDWLSTERALEIIDRAYQDNPHFEYIYTNWMYSHNQQIGISRPIPNNDWDAYRDPWITSAMATFKVGAFRQIPHSNFLDSNGEYFKMGTDHAYILPLTHVLKEKWGDYRSIGFIDMPLYVYQFIENEARRRVDIEGNWERETAHDAATFIRRRGFVSG